MYQLFVYIRIPVYWNSCSYTLVMFPSTSIDRVRQRRILSAFWYWKSEEAGRIGVCEWTRAVKARQTWRRTFRSRLRERPEASGSFKKTFVRWHSFKILNTAPKIDAELCHIVKSACEVQRCQFHTPRIMAYICVVPSADDISLSYSVYAWHYNV
jgi:hypothetical protein